VGLSSLSCFWVSTPLRNAILGLVERSLIMDHGFLWIEPSVVSKASLESGRVGGGLCPGECQSNCNQIR
jgi:hypothetical protein